MLILHYFKNYIGVGYFDVMIQNGDGGAVAITMQAGPLLDSLAGSPVNPQKESRHGAIFILGGILELPVHISFYTSSSDGLWGIPRFQAICEG